MLRNSRDRYGSLSITLHWLMLLLIAAVYACIELPPLIGPDEARAESLGQRRSENRWAGVRVDGPSCI